MLVEWLNDWISLSFLSLSFLPPSPFLSSPVTHSVMSFAHFSIKVSSVFLTRVFHTLRLVAFGHICLKCFLQHITCYYNSWWFSHREVLNLNANESTDLFQVTFSEIMNRRGYEGTFWSTGNVPDPDLSILYKNICIYKESFNCTHICACYYI